MTEVGREWDQARDVWTLDVPADPLDDPNLIREVAVLLRRYMADDDPFADGIAVSMAEAVIPIVAVSIRR